MFRQIAFFDNFATSLTDTWSAFLFQGLFSILVGVAILVFPQLLVAMVASAFVFVGLVCLTLAWKTRGVRRRYMKWRDEFWEPL